MVVDRSRTDTETAEECNKTTESIENSCIEDTELRVATKSDTDETTYTPRSDQARSHQAHPNSTIHHRTHCHTRCRN